MWIQGLPFIIKVVCACKLQLFSISTIKKVNYVNLSPIPTNSPEINLHFSSLFLHLEARQTIRLFCRVVWSFSKTYGLFCPAVPQKGQKKSIFPCFFTVSLGQPVQGNTRAWNCKGSAGPARIHQSWSGHRYQEKAQGLKLQGICWGR